MLAYERLPWPWLQALALVACPDLGSLPMGAALALDACPLEASLALAACLGLSCMPFNVVKGFNGDKALGPDGDSEI